MIMSAGSAAAARRLLNSVKDMSICTQTQRGTQAPQRARLVGAPLALTFMAEFTSLTSFFLLFSVMRCWRPRQARAARPPG
jgi:hypothetical protein